MNIIEQLIQYDEAYESGKPLINNRDYDLLKSKTRLELPSHPYFNDVGSIVKGDKVKLPVVLGSLNKVKTTDGSLNTWLKDNKGAKVTWAKLDGISLYEEYVNGLLVKAYTRGNGEVGRDVTSKAYLFSHIEVKGNFTGEVRGEVMLIGDSYKDMGYTTRRNGAAGLINQDELTNVDQLIFKVYELISDSKGVPDTELSRVQRLTEYGFPLCPCDYWVNDVDEYTLITMLGNYKDMGFDVDGVVIVCNESEREDVKYPTYKCAFKQNEEAIPCEVVNVEWNVGRTGRIVPTVVIKTTIIDGVEVSRATGFNAKFIQDNCIEVGTIVNIVRAGSVIPYIDSVETI